MRASPTVEVALARFGHWQVGICLLASTSALSALAWWVTQQRLPPVGAGWATGAALCALAWLTLSLIRVPDARLRWDGRGWHLRQAGSAESVPGEVAVVVDLGPWMLLRFDPLTRPRWSAPVWLPVQRTAIATQWHALRCAVHSPRPAPRAESALP